jgi:hypothetical protein
MKVIRKKIMNEVKFKYCNYLALFLTWITIVLVEASFLCIFLGKIVEFIESPEGIISRLGVIGVVIVIVLSLALSISMLILPFFLAIFLSERRGKAVFEDQSVNLAVSSKKYTIPYANLQRIQMKGVTLFYLEQPEIFHLRIKTDNEIIIYGSVLEAIKTSISGAKPLIDKLYNELYFHMAKVDEPYTNFSFD